MTDLRWACLQEVILFQAHLQGTNLEGAKLQRANLIDAQLQGIDLTKMQLQGAGKVRWSSDMSFEERIRSQIDQETDLSGVIFEDEFKKI